MSLAKDTLHRIPHTAEVGGQRKLLLGARRPKHRACRVQGRLGGGTDAGRGRLHEDRLVLTDPTTTEDAVVGREELSLELGSLLEREQFGDVDQRPI